jgi:hypothetical protein
MAPLAAFESCEVLHAVSVVTVELIQKSVKKIVDKYCVS